MTAEFAAYLVQYGIDSISLNPNSFIGAAREISAAEQRLERACSADASGAALFSGLRQVMIGSTAAAVMYLVGQISDALSGGSH